MNEEIAVLVGMRGESATLYDSSEVVVYQKSCHHWNPVRSMPFVLEENMGLPQLRVKMKELVDFLAECRTFSALSICGLPYFELEKAGFRIWEMEGLPVDFLQIILNEEEVVLKEETIKENPEPAAKEIFPGHFLISLKEIQVCGQGRSSKQIILPILRQEFKTLEILCDHLPPWLEAKMLDGEVQGTVDKTASGETRICILR
ncbi:MAG TPA: Fe-only nitrogenase accessory AnfO family protein [Syntrophomonadaceae bacterium]|nr:Fe-only nitrogenase accessory AnfO family protein [Syntrophomonadaceae bacterium]